MPYPHPITREQDSVVIHAKCISCSESKDVEVPLDNYFNWQVGKSIQSAFPDLSADDRELLISGVCGSCYDKMFSYKGAD